MENLEEIEKAVKSLPPKALKDFRRWFTAFDSKQWDEQIGTDAKSGKFDQFAAQAIASYKKGDIREL